MIKASDVDFSELKDACKALNAVEDGGLLEAVGVGTLKTVAIKKSDLMTNFVAAVEAVANQNKDDQLPADCITMYNTLVANGDGDEGGDDDPAPAGDGDEDPPKAKKKGEKKPKAKKAPKPKSRYGHIQSAASGQLDDALYEGGTFEEIMEKLDVSRGRINSHMKALRNKGLTVVVKEGKHWKETHVKVKEKSI